MEEKKINRENKKATSRTLKSDKKPRENWEEAFKEMAENGDDKLLIPDIFKDETF